jgi:hypothetical protein
MVAAACVSGISRGPDTLHPEGDVLRVDESLGDQVSLPLSLSHRGLHPLAARPAEDALELPVPIKMELTRDALRFDDEHPMSVDDQMVYLSHLTFMSESQVVEDEDIWTVVAE